MTKERVARILRLDPILSDRLDKARGPMAWNAYVTTILQAHLNGMEKVVKKTEALTRGHVTADAVEAIQQALDAPVQSAWQSLGLGRPQAKPGSLLKKDKK